ncbi:hypothetical protein F5Y03DRAFT_176443 [Xylaria venustula]|nr:hypothetical protein F5Y03DRAFT_176443 [Xylaria venustula]
MSTYGSIVNGLVRNLPFANIYQYASVNGSQAPAEAIPAAAAVVGNTTASPATVNNDVLTAVNTAVVGSAILYTTVTPQSSVSPDPTAQDSPAETLSGGILDFLSSGDDIITPAPTPSDDEPPPKVTVDSAIPKITIETVRKSTPAATTTPGGQA